MDSLMTHFIHAQIVIAFYMTNNSARALETLKNPLEIESYEIKPWFSIFTPTRVEQLNGFNSVQNNKT